MKWGAVTVHDAQGKGSFAKWLYHSLKIEMNYYFKNQGQVNKNVDAYIQIVIEQRRIQDWRMECRSPRTSESVFGFVFANDDCM